MASTINRILTPRDTVTFFVTGSGPFPIDMLRHDRCTPARGKDSAKIDQTFVRGSNRGTFEIMLTSTIKVPTEGRWESFGWKVSAVTVDRRPK